MPTNTADAVNVVAANRFADALADANSSITYAERHLNEAWQDAALVLRETGRTYGQIATHLNMTGRGSSAETARYAAIYACRAAARRRDGTLDAVVRYRHRNTVTISAVAGPLLNRRYGVEIEFSRGSMQSYYPTTDIAEALADAGINAVAESYNHETRPHWKVTTDATVSGGECVSPILTGNAGYGELRDTMRIIRQAGANVDRACGTHVHHDVTDFDTDAIARLIRSMRHTQAAFAAYVPRSRWNAGYSRLLNDYAWDRLDRNVNEGTLFASNQGRRYPAAGFYCEVDRHMFYNFQSLGTYGTVEFRGHSGTLNAAKLRPWIAVAQALIEWVRQGNQFDQAQTVTSMLDTFTNADLLTEAMSRKFLARVNQLGNNF